MSCRHRYMAVAAAWLSLALLSGCSPEPPASFSPVLSAGQTSGTATPAAEAVPAARDVPAALTTGAPKSLAPDPSQAFDAKRAMADARAIAAFGSRPGGSTGEREAAEYVAQRLREMGYDPVVETFALPGGKTSRNVIAIAPGMDGSRQVIIGGHIDSKPPSPGANDNASGCGVVLEIARLLKEQPIAADVRFVFWGTEEFLRDQPGDNHHLGSRHDAASLSATERDRTAAVISVDMVGYGDKFLVRTMRKGPRTLSDALLAHAKREKIGLAFERDRGKTGWSDHEPYELLGMPAAWLQWHDDPTYHTTKDVGSHLAERPFAVTGRFLLGYLTGLTPEALDELAGE